MKFKIEPMRDIYDEGRVKGYLIFAQKKPRARWLPCKSGDNPLFFVSATDAMTKLHELEND